MSAAATTVATPRHGLQRGEFVAMMSMLMATIAISIDTLLPAFDEIEAQFDLDPADSPISLTITVFFVAMGVSTLVWGPLADRFGRKPVMYAALGLIIVGALVSTFATSFEVLLAGRVFWGAAAAGPRTVILAIVRDSYEGDVMARIMSLVTAVFLIVPILAPGLGELLLLVGSWRLTTGAAAVLAGIGAIWFSRLNETLAPQSVLPLEFGRIGRAAKTVASNRQTMLFTLATTLGYGAFFPWLGSSPQLIGTIYGRPLALFFGLNAALMALTIAASSKAVARFGTRPVLLTMMTISVVTAAVYVAVALAAGGVPPFWLWFALVTVLTATNSSSTPLLQTLSMAPMGAIAGTASSVTGAMIFIVGGVLGSIIDGFISTTVTAFGVGFLVFIGVGLLAVMAGQPARVEGEVEAAT